MGFPDYLYAIPHDDIWQIIKPVSGGWSDDTKYHVITSSGDELLVRVSPISQITEKRNEFSVLQQLNFMKNYSRPFVFGKLPAFDKVYMVLQWVEGKNVEECIHSFPISKRYQLGWEAGEALRKMHTLPGTISQETRKTVLMSKLKSRHERCKEKGLVDPDLDIVYSFIYDNLDIFYQRRPTFLHGDYQGRNIIITNDQHIGVIDFNRIAEGDPYYDFSRLVEFTRFFDEAFSAGQIDGYFEGKVPIDFFAGMQFYAALAAVNSLNYGLLEEDFKVIDSMEKSLFQQIYDTKAFTNVIPSWYSDLSNRADSIIT